MPYDPVKAKAKNARRRRARMDMVRRAREVPCLDCDEQYPWYVMEFDHVRGTKRFGIAESAQGRGLSELILEMEKCDVVCANCHRIRTHKRRIEDTRVSSLTVGRLASTQVV